MTALLVVEDDPTLRRALTRTFRREFAAVHDAASVTEGLSIAAEHTDAIEVAVVDITLPDGCGLDLATELRRADPTIGLVVASGAADRDAVDQAVALGVQGYVLKPFDLAEVRINVASARQWRHAQKENAAIRSNLEGLVDARTRELAESRWETVKRLSMAAA